MSQFDYNESAADALELLTEFGGPIKLQDAAAGNYDRATGKVSGGSAQPFPAVGVLLSFKPSRTQSDQQNQEGTNIRAGDKRLLVAAAGLTTDPQPGFTVVIGSDTYNVVRVLTLKPAGVAILHELQVRK